MRNAETHLNTTSPIPVRSASAALGSWLAKTILILGILMAAFQTQASTNVEESRHAYQIPTRQAEPFQRLPLNDLWERQTPR